MSSCAILPTTAGQLIKVGTGTATTTFLYDGDALVAEYDGSNALLRRYLHGLGPDGPLVWFETAGTGETVRQLLTDHQGSIVGVTDALANLLAVNTMTNGIPGAGNTGILASCSRLTPFAPTSAARNGPRSPASSPRRSAGGPRAS